MGIEKEEVYKFQLLNIKLQTTKVGQDKENAYRTLIEKLVDLKIHAPVAKNKHVILYSYYQGIAEEKKQLFLYGNLGKGIYFDQKQIENILLSEKKSITTTPNKDIILNSEIAQYIFIPVVHKFCVIIKTGSTINANQLLKFFTKALSQVADKEDIVEVEIIKDPAITDRILSSYAIHSLNYVISYTNDDPTRALGRMFDARLKKLRAGKIAVELKANESGTLNKEEPDELIQGGIQLAEQNGMIKQAVITEHEGEKKQKLLNQNQPRTFKKEASAATMVSVIVNDIIKMFTE